MSQQPRKIQIGGATLAERNTRKYYAEQSPRGFGNEYDVHVFSSRLSRDAWVEAHRNDGDVNSAYRGAYAVTAKEARGRLRQRGDAATEIFNRLVEH